MPNWVFNTINNYSEDLYNKYSNEDENRAIDFNKIIPEPEEITKTISGSTNDTAKCIYGYTNYIQGKTDEELRGLKWDNKNPLKDRVASEAQRTTHLMGELAIENPDDSLHTILDKKGSCYQKDAYDRYVRIFGNKSYSNTQPKEMPEVYNNYINLENERFNEYKGRAIDEDDYRYQDKETLYEVGKYLTELEKKYGFDNWYDWRTANWGTKWNASESDYDIESGTLKFDTPWAIPYPVIAKIANDNPEAELDGYSEEETGWFEEYNSKNGIVNVTCEGELTWPDEDDSDQIVESRTELDPPRSFSYDEIAEQERKQWASFKTRIGSAV